MKIDRQAPAERSEPSQTEINRAKWAALKAQRRKTNPNNGGLCLLVALGGIGWGVVGLAIIVPHGWLYVCLILAVCCLLLQDKY